MANPDQQNRALDIFSTCPQSRDHAPQDYLGKVIDAARWSEEAGCTGMLIYTDNGLVDPWAVADLVIRHTEKLCPLVAVQPIYMHPYSAAKRVASVAYLHGRRICLNMLAGGFRSDLQALNDPTPHDDRYVRTTEYTLIMKALLETNEPITFDGRYYSVQNLRLTPSLPSELHPQILMSGSSEAGMAAAEATASIGIVYPPPVEELGAQQSTAGRGVRLGIMARPDAAEAWRLAHERFPADRKGQVTHKLAMAVSDSVWHKQLSARADRPEGGPSPYWLWPFQSYKTFCPYLVGSYEEVANYVSAYLDIGYRTYILDVPRSPDDLESARVVFDMALAGRRPQHERNPALREAI